MKSYDAHFHSYAANTSRRAAERIGAIVRTLSPIASVLDVGCGYGTWLHAWQDAGVGDIYGVDGPWVDPARLEIATPLFLSHDLGRSFDLGRRFDLVESLEVAEHLPAASASTFVDSLARHGDLVLFSAAPPGQGGEHHVNEQPYDYWRELFRARDFVAFDCIRPRLAGDHAISPWYRYNVLLYARPDAVRRMTRDAQATRLADASPVPDIAPWMYRMRRRLVRTLPRVVQDGLARTLAYRYSRTTRPTQR
jgi:SAM-dependent methyltransferase